MFYRRMIENETVLAECKQKGQKKIKIVKKIVQ